MVTGMGHALASRKPPVPPARPWGRVPGPREDQLLKLSSTMWVQGAGEGEGGSQCLSTYSVLTCTSSECSFIPTATPQPSRARSPHLQVQLEK